MSSLRIAGVIPARLSSTRLSRKVLRIIAGRPMVEWVWRAAMASGLMDPVVVATDSGEVALVLRERGIPVAMTPVDCPSGSDRVRKVARQIDADIYVNIQGDEPTLTPEFFPPLLALFDRDGAGFGGYRKHLGIYAYRKAALERFAALEPSPLERMERLEQLRLLENGIGLYVAEAPGDAIGVDTEADLVRAEAVLRERDGGQAA